MEPLLRLAKLLIPKSLFESLQPTYHYLLSILGAIIYRFPSRHLNIVGVTGTKGKSSVCELANAILEEAGFETALASTIRFKIGSKSRPNMFKMTMPGRFFIQKFLRDAVNASCRWVVLEMTSHGVLQSRHKFIELNALVFTNLAPEHIESHGSYEKYLSAKLEIAQALAVSRKTPKAIIANADDKEGAKFLTAAGNAARFPYSLTDAAPHHATDEGVSLRWRDSTFFSPLKGEFSMYNIIAAATFAESQGIPAETIKRAIERVSVIRGRGEEVRTGQTFTVVVDYAHTPESLTEIYRAYGSRKKICVLGNTGGGRDKWKRPKMAEIAERECTTVILTNEDPYDEDPQTIVQEMARGMKKKKPEIIMDRREAIAKALALAKETDVVLITGKGTDPYICGSRGTKTRWSDSGVAAEELAKLLKIPK